MLKGRDLLSVHDLSSEEVESILALAEELKAMQKAGIEHRVLAGKTLGMIFEKSSTRTRVSFETGMFQLGGQALFLSNRDLQIGRGEPIKDTARVLSRYLDGVMIRTFEHEKVEEFAKYADIPVINALTDLLHPCQALTDLLTIREHKGKNLKGLKMAYGGDGNNMTHSLMYAAAKTGMNFVAATPADYAPDEGVTQRAQEDAKETGASIALVIDPFAAAKDADILVTDTWASMGQEAEHALPARLSRRGDHGRRFREILQRHLRRGGEPPAYAEGNHGSFDGGLTSSYLRSPAGKIYESAYS